MISRFSILKKIHRISPANRSAVLFLSCFNHWELQYRSGYFLEKSKSCYDFSTRTCALTSRRQYFPCYAHSITIEAKTAILPQTPISSSSPPLIKISHQDVRTLSSKRILLDDNCSKLTSTLSPVAPSNRINAPEIVLTTFIKPEGLHGTVSILAELSKARLTCLVVSTALAGCVLAAPTPFACDAFLQHPGLSMLALAFGTGLTSAAANTINQIMEVPYDSQMKRTKTRPLVRGLITPLKAGLFAVASASSGIFLLYSALNPLVAILSGSTLILYTCVYTPLKRVSQINTWVGSLVGAIPPLMGWAAATGALEWGSLMLAGLLFSWQFPHFMALSWNLRNDYARAGFVMTSNVNPGLCKRAALRYSVVSTLVCLAGAGCSAVSLGPWGGWSLGVGSLPVNMSLIYHAWKFYDASPENSSAAARRLFRVSLVHLPVVMLSMLVCSHWTSFSWF